MSRAMANKEFVVAIFHKLVMARQTSNVGTVVFVPWLEHLTELIVLGKLDSCISSCRGCFLMQQEKVFCLGCRSVARTSFFFATDFTKLIT